MAPRQVGRAAALGVAHEGAQPGPCAQHVGPVERLGQRAVDGADQVVDVLGGALGVVDVAVVVGVGRADVGDRALAADPAVGAGPRHDEDRPPVLGHGHDGGDVVAHLVPRDGDVDALGRPDGVGAAALLQRPHVVGPHAGGVDDDPGRDLDGAVAGVDERAGDAVARAPQPGHAGVVDDDGAEVERRGPRHGQREPGVVGLGVVVEVGPGQAVVERGHVGAGRVPAQPPVPLADAQAAGEVVHPHGGPERPGHLLGDDALLAGEHRDEEGQDLDQVGGVAQQALALVQRLVDEAHVAVLQVAQPAVDELGRLGRRARGEVVPLDQRGAQAAGRGVERHAGAGDAAADDEHVEDAGAEEGEVVVAIEGAEGHGRSRGRRRL